MYVSITPPEWYRNVIFGGRGPWTKTIPTQSAQRIYPVARVLELPTGPPLPFRVTMPSRDVWVEGLLNIRCIVKGYIIFSGNKTTPNED